MSDQNFPQFAPGEKYGRKMSTAVVIASIAAAFLFGVIVGLFAEPSVYVNNCDKTSGKEYVPSPSTGLSPTPPVEQPPTPPATDDTSAPAVPTPNVPAVPEPLPQDSQSKWSHDLGGAVHKNWDWLKDQGNNFKDGWNAYGSR